jgi:hypothetical protein
VETGVKPVFAWYVHQALLARAVVLRSQTGLTPAGGEPQWPGGGIGGVLAPSRELYLRPPRCQLARAWSIKVVRAGRQTRDGRLGTLLGGGIAVLQCCTSLGSSRTLRGPDGFLDQHTPVADRIVDGTYGTGTLPFGPCSEHGGGSY